MKRTRCTAFLDYNVDTAIRCKLDNGHAGKIHKTNGWEPVVGNTGLLVKVLIAKAKRR